MAFVSMNAVFQILWVASFIQHFLIIIGFQKSRVAPAEMADYMLARKAYICKNANIDVLKGYYKAVRICSIMKFWKSSDRKAADGNRLISGERLYRKMV